MPVNRIGENLRFFRKQQTLSLQALAEKSGFSKGYLSKLENGFAQAPIATLMNLSSCLGVPINRIFDGPVELEKTGCPETVLTRRGERESISDSRDRGYRYERLAVGSAFRMTPYMIHLDDDDAPTRTFRHPGEEMIFVTQGSCNYRVAENIHRLETGDTLIFDAMAEHGPIKIPGVDASYLAVFDQHETT